MGKSQKQGWVLSDLKLIEPETSVHFCRQGCVSADRQLHCTLSFPKLHLLQRFCSVRCCSAAVHHLRCNVWRMSATTHSFPSDRLVQCLNPVDTFPFSPLVSFIDQIVLQIFANSWGQNALFECSCTKALLNKSQFSNFYEIRF